MRVLVVTLVSPFGRAWGRVGGVDGLACGVDAPLCDAGLRCDDGPLVIVRRSIGEHEDADCDECMGNGAHTVNGTRIMHRMSTFISLIKVGDGPY